MPQRPALRRALPAVLLALAASRIPAQDLYDETVLRTVELTFKQPDWLAQLAANYRAKTYIRADFKVDGRTFRDVGVRYRGNSSYLAVNSLKKPFKIKLDAFGGTEDLYGYRTLNLNNGFRDPTFVREVLSYHMLRRCEPASRANWVVLRVNGQNYGVYINVEQINKDMLRAWFEDVDGFRYRGERGLGGTGDDPAFKWLGSNPLDYRRGYELKSANTTGAWTNLVQTCSVLNHTPANQLHALVPQIVDVDECIRYLAGNNLLPAMDSYIGGTAHNFYIYEDPLHRRTVLMPWDLNASFGANSWLSVVQKQQLSPWYFTTTKPHRPLLSRVIVEPEWRQRYIAHMRAMMADFYSWSFAAPLIARYQRLIQSAVQQDPIKLYPMSQFVPSVTQDLQVSIGGRYQWIPGIQPMIDKRRAYLQSLPEFRTVPPGLGALGQQPARPRDQDTVWITARVQAPAGLAFVKLYWRTVGAYRDDPMFDDGRHQDGAANDGVYGAAIPRQNLGTRVEYYVGARSALTSGGAMAFLPATGGHRPPTYRITELTTPTPLSINELLADNKTVDRDQAGDYDDWVEIHNSSNAPIPLQGYHLSDDLRNPKAWAFPAGVSIPAGGFLRVWLDNEPAEGPLHATFSLARDGEAVVLSDPNGRVLDLMTFGEQKTDRAYGRLPDGTGDPYFLWPPTANAAQLGTAIGRAVMFDLRKDGSGSGMELMSTSVPRIGNFLNVQLFRGAANTTVLLGISAGLRPVSLGAIGPLLVDTNLLVTVPVQLDAAGFGGISARIPPAVLGITAILQAAGQDLSNGLAVRFTR